jgi:hypothetical protein
LQDEKINRHAEKTHNALATYWPAPVPLSTTTQPPAQPPAFMSPAERVSSAVVSAVPFTPATRPKYLSPNEPCPF